MCEDERESELIRVMELASEYEKADQQHNDGFYSAYELRVLYREIIRLNESAKHDS